jgi:hypothetical protein
MHLGGLVVDRATIKMRGFFPFGKLRVRMTILTRSTEIVNTP